MILYENIKEVYTTEVTYLKTLYVLSLKLPIKMKEILQNYENLFDNPDNYIFQCLRRK